MSSFTKNIKPYVQTELDKATELLKQGQDKASFKHLENAHVLGQESTYLHVLSHVHMARWAVQQRAFKELIGQLIRIVGAATKTAIGLVPTGNTGGANISPFKQLPLSDKHAKLIKGAKTLS